MDKKTVINEQQPDKQEKTTVKEPQKPEEAQLQVGQSVVLMDSNLRGRIIRGIGDGILKAAIRKELDEVLALRCSYSVGAPAVTIVYIK